MKPKEIKKRILWLPSWGLSLVAIAIIFFLVMVISNTFGNYGTIIGYITLAVLVPSACFFICWKDPKSVWYVPILCNVITILPAMFDAGVWTGSAWVIFCIAWALSIITAIIGALAGLHAAKRGTISGR